MTWGFNRLVLEAVETPTKVLEPGTQKEYRMAQLWLRNAISRDAYHVKVACEWSRQGAEPHVRSEPGQWFYVKAPGLADISQGGEDQIDISSNGSVEHLGLVVKYTADRFAFLVTPASHQLYLRTGHWRHDHMAITPGEYSVTLRFQSSGGYRSVIRLAVSNPGKDAILTVQRLQKTSAVSD